MMPPYLTFYTPDLLEFCGAHMLPRGDEDCAPVAEDILKMLNAMSVDVTPTWELINNMKETL